MRRNNNIFIAPPPGERGRENGSFLVAEILKPMGFRKFELGKILEGAAMFEFLAGNKLPGIVALEKSKNK